MRDIRGVDLDLLEVGSGVRVVYFDGAFCKDRGANRAKFARVGRRVRAGEKAGAPYAEGVAADVLHRERRHYFYHCTVDDDDEAMNFVVDAMRVRELPAVFTFYGACVYLRGGGAGGVPHWLGVPGVPHQSRRRSSSGHASAPPPSPTTEDGTGTGTGTSTDALPGRTSPLVALSRTTGTKLFVSGDRSSVGKTTTCLGLLASLVESGVPASSLAYIKPVTQCEAEQPVSRYCRATGILDAPGPVIFYKGFTRAFLAGDTPSSAELLEQAAAAVENVSRGKAFTLIDGVGYPSVGSICGISNAHVAQRLGVPVLLVGKSGVGDAVDAHNLNSTFFEHKGVPVLGSIFNKLATEGFYSREACKEAVDTYFQLYRTDQDAYGFMPAAQFAEEGGGSDGILPFAHAVQGLFQYVDTDGLLEDAHYYSLPTYVDDVDDDDDGDESERVNEEEEMGSRMKVVGTSTGKRRPRRPTAAGASEGPSKRLRATALAAAPLETAILRSRADIERAAAAAGAKGG